jgi:hypothetical protein
LRVIIIAYPSNGNNPLGKAILSLEDAMPRICGEVVLKCSKKDAFREISSIDFGDKMGLAFKSPQREILFQNARMTRTRMIIENVGVVDMERIYIFENHTIIAKRIPPMAPFSFFLGLQILVDHADGTLLKWAEEFELDAENKAKENGMLIGLEKHEREQFQRIKDYFG